MSVNVRFAGGGGRSCASNMGGWGGPIKVVCGRVDKKKHVTSYGARQVPDVQIDHKCILLLVSGTFGRKKREAGTMNTTCSTISDGMTFSTVSENFSTTRRFLVHTV